MGLLTDCLLGQEVFSRLEGVAILFLLFQRFVWQIFW